MIERFDLGGGYRISRVIKGGWQLAEGHGELFRFRLGEQDRREIDAVRAELTMPSGDVFDLERDRSGRHGRIMKYNLNAD